MAAGKASRLRILKPPARLNPLLLKPAMSSCCTRAGPISRCGAEPHRPEAQYSEGDGSSVGPMVKYSVVSREH